jgi:hypothetical protein
MREIITLPMKLVVSLFGCTRELFTIAMKKKKKKMKKKKERNLEKGHSAGIQKQL